MSHSIAMGIALAVPTGATAQQVIAGPTVLAFKERNWQFSGIEFTANRDTTLTSFTFDNQGNADTILLTDLLGNELHSVSTLPGMPTDIATVDWSLDAGQSYLLFRTTSSNSLYANWDLALPSNQDITILNSGFFSGAYADLGAFPSNLYWSSFTNITTSAVPEPISWVMMLIGLCAISMVPRRNFAFDAKRPVKVGGFDDALRSWPPFERIRPKMLL